MIERMFRVIVFFMVSLSPVIYLLEFFRWIIYGKFIDTPRKMMCYALFGKYEELI